MTLRRSKSMVKGFDLALKKFGNDLQKYAGKRYSAILFSRILYSSFCEKKIHNEKNNKFISIIII